MCTVAMLSSGGNTSEAAILNYIYPFLMPLFFFCLIKSYSLCNKYLELNQDSVTFPGFDRNNYLLKSLKEIHCLHGDIIFKFGNETKKFLNGKLTVSFEGETIKSIALNRISQKDRELLISWIQSNKPELMNDLVRDRISNANDEEYIFDPAGQLVLAYDSHKKARAFVEVCKQYEKLFWTVWILGCSPLLILELPIILALPELMVRRWIFGETGYISTPSYMNEWGTLWRPFIEVGEKSIGTSASAYWNFLQHSLESAFILWLLALLCIIASAFSMFKPNKLFLNSEFMEKFLMFGPIRMTYGKITWSRVKSIKLKQLKTNKDSAAVLDKTIVFEASKNEHFELAMSSLNNEERRAAVLKAIETWGSHCQIDPEIFQVLSAVQKNSYTELWLQSLNSPPKRERLRPLATGDLLQGGKYKITQLLATGGQGIAYVAQKVSNNATSDSFVIKEFMLPVYVDRKARSQSIERFENESNVLSSLENDAIVKLDDHFIEDHRAYLVLEHIKGMSLRDLVKNSEPISESKALDLCKQMCEMLTYLHEQTPSLVHRDFTPDNLILEDSGKLKLIDFNVVHQSNTNKTSATIVGKHSYMPPEQFAGRPVPQSDLYALGATIYYLLSGEDPEAFSQSFLPSKRPDLAPRWAEVISRCTALSLAERAQSARELSLMLDFTGEENESLPEAIGGRDVGVPYEILEHRSRQDAGAPGIEPVSVSINEPEAIEAKQPNKKELEEAWQS